MHHIGDLFNYSGPLKSVTTSFGSYNYGTRPHQMHL